MTYARSNDGFLAIEEMQEKDAAPTLPASQKRMPRITQKRTKGLVVALATSYILLCTQFHQKLVSPRASRVIDAPLQTTRSSVSLDLLYVDTLAATKSFYTNTSGTIKPRVFHPSPGNPCVLVEDESPSSSFESTEPSNDGLLLVKIKKAGSSTLAGIAARIAHAMTPTTSGMICKSRMTHEWSQHQLQKCQGGFQQRNHSTSYLWTMLRDPASRALSDFFFEQVGRNGVDPSTAVSYLQRVQNFHVYSLATSSSKRAVQRILQEFNFIGILERLDESLVILQILLNLQPSDVLYLQAAKQNGAYDPQNNCSSIPKRTITPEIETFLSSDEWKENNKADYMLYKAVNASMDQTIDSIGRDTFQRALHRFQEARALANHYCQSMSPCVAQGVYRPPGEVDAECYARDWGCGYKCLDRLFEANRTTIDARLV